MTPLTSIVALVAALNAPPSGAPRQVELAAGAYSAIIIRCADLADRATTVVPADPANPPTVAGLEVNTCNGLTFKGIDWTVSPRTLAVATIQTSRNVYIVGGRMHAAGLAGSGVLFRWCSYCGVSGTEIFNLGTGVRGVASDHIVLAKDSVHDLTGDGFQFNATSFVTLDGNSFSDFYPKPGDHPDAMQFFTTGQTAPVTDITITNNSYTRGKGGPTQGAFLGNEVGQPYQNVTITGNTFNGAMYRAISVSMGQVVTIGGNKVQAWADMGSGIYTDRSTGVVSTGNAASFFSPLTLATGSLVLKPVAVGDMSVFAPAPPPPVADPKDAQIAALTAQLATTLTERDAATAREAAANTALALTASDLARAVQAGAALQTERDAATALAAARQAILDQIKALAGQ